MPKGEIYYLVENEDEYYAEEDFIDDLISGEIEEGATILKLKVIAKGKAIIPKPDVWVNWNK